MARTSGCSNRRAAACRPPWTMLKTPSGSPASSNSSASSTAVRGVRSLGFSTKVLPHAIATGNILSAQSVNKTSPGLRSNLHSTAGGTLSFPNSPFKDAPWRALAAGDKAQGGDPVETTVYLIIVDGLRADFGRRYFAGINRWLKEGKAAYTTLRSGLPSDSRPSYALIATGVDGSVNTITSNGSRQRCPAPNIFGLARQKGLRTGGAMYHWWSELFNKTPFDPATDHRQYDLERDIQDGYFYNSDETPDEVIFAKAREIRAHSRPHLLVIHPMSVDYAGDNLGGAAS